MQQMPTPSGTATHAAGLLPSGKLALWWFLASEIITFGGLLCSYLVFRLAHPEWAEEAHHLSTTIATLNTIVLLSSSLTIVLAFAAVDAGDQRAARKWMGLTVVGGVVFLLIKTLEWSLEINAGRVPAASGFWSFYFALTGLHGLHVLGGVVVNVALWLAMTPRRWQAVAHRVEYAGLYWHFVDIVWIFLFPMLYLG